MKLILSLLLVSQISFSDEPFEKSSQPKPETNCHKTLDDQGNEPQLEEIEEFSDRFEVLSESTSRFWDAVKNFFFKSELQEGIKSKLSLAKGVKLKDWLYEQAELNLSGLDLSKKELEFIISHIHGPSLNSMDLSGNFAISNSDVIPLLKKTNNLKHLNVSHSHCNGELIAEIIDEAPEIQRLTVDHVRSGHLDQLLELKNLRFLDISNTSISKFWSLRFSSFVPSITESRIEKFMIDARAGAKIKGLHTLVLPNVSGKFGRHIRDFANEFSNPNFKVNFSQSFENPRFSGNLKDVYDGDTIKLDLPELTAFYGLDQSIRLLGIDTAEMNPKSTDLGNRPKSDLEFERKCAKAARNFVFHHLSRAGNGNFRLMNVSRGKYRLLADVQVKVPTNYVVYKLSGGKAGYQWLSLSAEMVRLGLALSYDGTTKAVHQKEGFRWRRHYLDHKSVMDYWRDKF